MAKFKPAGSRKVASKRSNKDAIPCFFLILMVIALVSFLFYELLKSGG